MKKWEMNRKAHLIKEWHPFNVKQAALGIFTILLSVKKLISYIKQIKTHNQSQKTLLRQL